MQGLTLLHPTPDLALRLRLRLAGWRATPLASLAPFGRAVYFFFFETISTSRHFFVGASAGAFGTVSGATRSSYA